MTDITIKTDTNDKAETANEAGAKESNKPIANDSQGTLQIGGEQTCEQTDADPNNQQEATSTKPSASDDGDAQSRVRLLDAKLNEIEETLVETRNALEASERRRAVDLALIDAGAFDLESVRLIVEQLMDTPDHPDATQAVASTKRRKPHLFHNPSSATASAMSAKPRDLDVTIRSAAQQAASTGDRNALLRYLRLRRGA